MVNKMKDTLNKIKDLMMQSDVMEIQSFAKTVEFFQPTRVFCNGNCLRMTRDVNGPAVGRKNIKMVSEILKLEKTPQGYTLENLRVYDGIKIAYPKTILTMQTDEQGNFVKGNFTTFGEIQGKVSFDIAKGGENIKNYKVQKSSKNPTREK